MSAAAMWLARAVELAGALLIGLAMLQTLAALMQGGSSEQRAERMRLMLAQGVVGALGLMSAAALLKTIGLRSWNSIGMFVVILTLRLVIKQSLAAELRGAGRPRRPSRASSGRSDNKPRPARG